MQGQSNANRDLVALRSSASTSRVINLAMLDELHGGSGEHRSKPLFKSTALNSSIIVKHRMRDHERRDMKMQRLNATKIILPFDVANLRIGGQVFFVGEANQADLLHQSAGVSAGDLEHDLPLLSSLDQLPSFDPFVLREQLRRNGYEPATTYFEISPGDPARMQAFVATEIRQLVVLAFGTEGGGAGDLSARLAEALLATRIDARLEPLRAILGLEGDAFRESIFSWKGLLYYKWTCRDLTAQIAQVISELGQLRITGPRDKPSMSYIAAAQENIRKSLRLELAAIKESIGQYDRMFDEMVAHAKASVFRDLLVNAPARFLQLGERVGNVGHIVSFWRFRFPDDRHLAAPIDDVMDILQDFEASIGIKTHA